MNDERTGYDENFLGNGIKVPIPKPTLENEGDVLQKDEFRDGYIVDYIHYSVIVSKSNKQSLITAANLDQKSYRVVSGRRWFVDPRIGAEYQIANEGYRKNEWDRGHLTRRTAVTWGPSDRKAKRASNDSCSYANSCLQHSNFNKDEWRVPEEAVRHWKKDKNGKLCIFTGPYFSEIDRWYTPKGQDVFFRIPSAFWKVVAYIDKKTGKLANQAYMMFQDDFFISDRRGKKRIKLNSYQITITELERLTGLDFDDSLAASNPLYYHPREGINVGPEGFLAPTLKNIDSKVVFERKDAENMESARKRIIKASEEDDG